MLSDKISYTIIVYIQYQYTDVYLVLYFLHLTK